MGVSIILVRGVVEAVERIGIARDDLLHAAGLERERLGDGAGRASFTEYDRLQCAAVELTGDDALGLHIGERTNSVAFNVFASSIGHAATLREGVTTFLRFESLLHDGPSSSFHEARQTATLCFRPIRGTACGERFNAEMFVAAFLRLVRHFAGPDTSVRRACFEYAAPHYVSEYSRIFQEAECFEQPFTGIEFDRALLNRVSLHADEAMHQMAEAQASRQMTRVLRETTFATRVLEYLTAGAAAERPEMNEVAQRFGMSARSMRRRLDSEGVRYPELVDKALATLAQRMLRDPKQSIASVAYQMGFSAPSAFHRAFKRWTGITPEHYRKRSE